METITLTDKEIALFKELAEDAGNWNGCPLWNQGGEKTKADNAVLASLVKKNLAYTESDSSYGLDLRKSRYSYVIFTKKGKDLIFKLFQIVINHEV